jgi:hypothetical protein
MIRKDLSSPAVGSDAKLLETGHPWRQHFWALIFFVALFSAFYSPAMLEKRLLAPGDGTLYYMPHYEMPHTLWDPDLMTGFPEMADPQVMYWYAPARLLSVIPGSWNWFVISAYILASWFTYLYIREVTRDGFAAMIGGVLYGLSGFMVAHLGHTTIIHAAAWIPGILLAAEELTRGVRVRWILIGGVIASQCILAGHPQITLYGLTLAGAYIVIGGIAARKGRLLQIGMSVAMIVLALVLSAIQIFATGTLAAITPRARLSFEEFSGYSLSAYHLILLVFPWLFGGTGAGIPYFAAWGVTEVGGYVGWSALVLACIGVLSLWRDRRVLFWVAAAIIALLAAMGPVTPVGRIVYSLPGFGQFRAQGRFVGIFGLAVAVLAGYGISAIRSRSKWPTDVTVIVGALLLLLVTAIFVIPAFGPQIRAAAAANGMPSFSVSITGNRSVRLPVISGLMLATALILFRWRPRSRGTEILLMAAMVCELSLFGWFAEWRYASPTAADVQPVAGTLAARQDLGRNGGRWLAVRFPYGRTDEAPPDLSALWKLPSIGKYGPLMPTRYRELLEIESNGIVFGNWWNPRDRALDIVGTRLLAFQTSLPEEEARFEGIPFPADEINVVTGNGCGAVSTREHISLRHGTKASSVGIISLMGCSTGLTQGSPVLAMRLHGTGGTGQSVVLKAGVDTAEWAALCTDVAPVIRHQPAAVFSRFSVPRGAGTCQGQKYGTIVNLPEGAMDVQSLDFEWLPKTVGVIRVIGLVFSGGAKTEAVQPMDIQLGDASIWKEFRRDRRVIVYENLRAQPRSWIVPETLSLDAADIKQAIQTSTLPDGRPYDPRAVALIEEPLGLQSPKDPEASAHVIAYANTSLDIQTINRQPAFLVLADLYYPGWLASVNGTPSRIFQTNYVQRGVLLPAGRNRVHFVFRPLSFYIGLGVSSAGVGLSILAALLALKRGIL